MAYLLDSNLVIPYLADDPATVTLVERLVFDGIAISIITYMEVYQGTLRSPDPERARVSFALFLTGVPVVPFSLAAAQRCAQLREDLARDGKRVRSRVLDLITAAIALEYGQILVTRNHKDYEDIPNLSLYQPSQLPYTYGAPT